MGAGIRVRPAVACERLRWPPSLAGPQRLHQWHGQPRDAYRCEAAGRPSRNRCRWPRRCSRRSVPLSRLVGESLRRQGQRAGFV